MAEIKVRDWSQQEIILIDAEIDCRDQFLLLIYEINYRDLSLSQRPIYVINHTDQSIHLYTWSLCQSLQLITEIDHRDWPFCSISEINHQDQCLWSISVINVCDWYLKSISVIDYRDQSQRLISVIDHMIDYRDQSYRLIMEIDLQDCSWRSILGSYFLCSRNIRFQRGQINDCHDTTN